jgi:hypothetical protein
MVANEVAPSTEIKEFFSLFPIPSPKLSRLFERALRG